MKIFANYLPQFHVIPENNEYWGDGFTDWVSCKGAKSLFEGHVQPKKPLKNNYYSLDNPDAVRWQTNLAKEYGLSGFGIYHYWFHSDLNLLTKPAEIIRDNKDIDIEYFFIWDNKSWKKTWSAISGGDGWIVNNEKETKTLAELIYGDESEWEAHFQFLLSFFKDERYLKIDNKPVFCFFNTFKTFNTLKEIESYWNKRCIQNGFDGIMMVSRSDYKQRQFEHSFVYTPFAATNWFDYIPLKFKRLLKKDELKKYNYDHLWKRILEQSKKYNSNVFLSGFVDFDDTPRRGSTGNVVVGSSPSKFKHFFSELLKIAKKNETPVVLLTAWNEWGEGCFLEPDTVNGYKYLEALKESIDSVNQE